MSADGGQVTLLSKAMKAEVVALDDVLTAPEGADPEQAKVAELRYFDGFSVAEIGEILEMSPRTGKQH
jgi:DNA-directed RNA polymerase specialized sigma24 family protein